jgi:hypothetical protein
MSSDELGRLKGDLAVMRSAMGLHVPFGRGMLAVGIFLTATATAAAVVSLLVEQDSLQQALTAAVMIAGLVGLFLRSRRTPGLDSEVVTQVAVSLSDWHYSYPLAHGLMAVGYLAAAAIQSAQLREAVASHASD